MPKREAAAIRLLKCIMYGDERMFLWRGLYATLPWLVWIGLLIKINLPLHNARARNRAHSGDLYIFAPHSGSPSTMANKVQHRSIDNQLIDGNQWIVATSDQKWANAFLHVLYSNGSVVHSGIRGSRRGVDSMFGYTGMVLSLSLCS